MGRLTTLKPQVKTLGNSVKQVSAADNSLRGTSRSRWDVVRRRVLQRDCGMCQECLRHSLPRQADEVDHIAALQHGGRDNDENLQSLCIPCHRRKTALEASGTSPIDYWSGIDPGAI